MTNLKACKEWAMAPWLQLEIWEVEASYALGHWWILYPAAKATTKRSERQQKRNLALNKTLACASDTNTIKSPFVSHSSVESH